MGIDIGSTTVKVVLLDNNDSIVYSDYRRHYSDLFTVLKSMTADTIRKVGDINVKVAITGSGGLSYSDKLGIEFIQEVIAGHNAIERYIPDVSVIIELGGEDAKLTFLKNGVDQRMNGICAGGTGAFIDQMAVLLKTNAKGLNDLSKNHKVIYPIAARCGVFAKTDIQPLINEGARAEDIAASIFQAVVNQTIGGLSCGRKIKGKVGFLGGPLCFLSELRARFKETLKLSDENAILPDNAEVYVAIGAAIASENTKSIISLNHIAEKLNVPFIVDKVNYIEPLFNNKTEYQEFKTRHSLSKCIQKDIIAHTGSVFLGLDIGSTTSKAVLIDKNKNILYKHYVTNQGNPIATVLDILNKIYAILPDKAFIKGCAVTGYGENLIKGAFKCDIGEVETVAHLTAARHFLPDVDMIIDIGGQDMKCIRLKDNQIDSVLLNEACSSGCGSFIETFAKCLNMSVEEFSNLALMAEHPVDLGSRCTVFMNSKVKQAQKEGASVGDISAGLSYSVIKNALNKVIKIKSNDDLGANIIVQGGAFLNDAILRSLEKTINRNVIRPDISGHMGAFGAAIIALKCKKKVSSLIKKDKLNNFSYESKTTRCKGCSNACLMTINTFSDNHKYISGNRCEKGSGVKALTTIPNLYEYKLKRLFDYTPLENPTRGVIGIPRALNMYENYPFWFTFFTSLKFKVILSPPSTRQIYEKGMDTISSDTICYPAKLAHGHIISLIENGVDTIFYPCITKEKAEFKGVDNTYNCPVVIAYSEVLKSNIDLIKDKNITFLNPFLPYHNIKNLTEYLYKELASYDIPLKEIKRAIHYANAENARFKEDIKKQGEKVIEYLAESGKKGIVLSGRPYHLDSEVNHGIPSFITSLGLAVLTEDSLAHMGKVKRPLTVLDQWKYHSRLYEAADYVAKQDNLELVQLNSFGCGPDSIASEQASDILKNKMYTMIKIDEVSNLGAIKIRLRSLKAAMEGKRKAVYQILEDNLPAINTKITPTHTILAPQMSPIHFKLLEQAFISEGYNLKVLEKADNKDIELGLKYVNNDTCYPAIIVIGQILGALLSGNYDLNSTAVIMVQTCGPCRASNYLPLLKKAMLANNLGAIPLVSLNPSGIENNGFKLSLPLIKKSMYAMIYGDMLMKMLLGTRPYEKNKGQTIKVYDKWIKICMSHVKESRYKVLKADLKDIARNFSIIEKIPNNKIKVGLVGEILVKYHPAANNNMIDFIESIGGELVVPSLTDFFLFCAHNKKNNYKEFGDNKDFKIMGDIFIKYIEHTRDAMREALINAGYPTILTIDEMADSVKNMLSLCNSSGEGWLLTAEMVELLDEGVNNIICMQPFACLPNHITGKGMIKTIKDKYNNVNIVTIDYDAGASEVNQINRIKLMLERARSALKAS